MPAPAHTGSGEAEARNENVPPVALDREDGTVGYRDPRRARDGKSGIAGAAAPGSEERDEPDRSKDHR